MLSVALALFAAAVHYRFRESIMAALLVAHLVALHWDSGGPAGRPNGTLAPPSTSDLAWPFMVHLVTVSLVQFAWFRYSDQKASHSSPSSKSLVILVVGTILGCLTACVYSLAAAAGVVHVALIAAVALETAASPSLAMAGLALVEALSLASLFFPRNLIVVVIRLAADLGLVCAELAPVDFTRGFLSASLALMLAIDLINHVMNLNETVDKLNAEKHSLENNLKLARDELQVYRDELQGLEKTAEYFLRRRSLRSEDLTGKERRTVSEELRGSDKDRTVSLETASSQDIEDASTTSETDSSEEEEDQGWLRVGSRRPAFKASSYSHGMPRSTLNVDSMRSGGSMGSATRLYSSSGRTRASNKPRTALSGARTSVPGSKPSAELPRSASSSTIASKSPHTPAVKRDRAKEKLKAALTSVKSNPDLPVLKKASTDSEKSVHAQSVGDPGPARRKASVSVSFTGMKSSNSEESRPRRFSVSDARVYSTTEPASLEHSEAHTSLRTAKKKSLKRSSTAGELPVLLDRSGPPDRDEDACSKTSEGHVSEGVEELIEREEVFKGAHRGSPFATDETLAPDVSASATPLEDDSSAMLLLSPFPRSSLPCDDVSVHTVERLTSPELKDSPMSFLQGATDSLLFAPPPKRAEPRFSSVTQSAPGNRSPLIIRRTSTTSSSSPSVSPSTHRRKGSAFSSSTPSLASLVSRSPKVSVRNAPSLPLLPSSVLNEDDIDMLASPPLTRHSLILSASQSSASSNYSAEAAGKTVRVLIATPDYDELAALKSRAHRLGCDVFHAKTVRDALAMLTAEDARFDLLLLDLRLGMGPCLAVPKQLEEFHLQRLKVVALTVAPSTEERQLCVQNAGMFEYFTLPLSRLALDGLLREIRSMLSSHAPTTPPSRSPHARRHAQLSAYLKKHGRSGSAKSSGTGADNRPPTMPRAPNARHRSTRSVDTKDRITSLSRLSISLSALPTPNEDEVASAGSQSARESNHSDSAPESLQRASTESIEADPSSMTPSTVRGSTEEEESQEEDLDDESMSDSDDLEALNLIQRYERLHELFDCFVPPQYQELVAPRGIEQLRLGDTVCRSLTIMFSDIRDFTAMSEAMYIDELMDFLHAYFAFALPPIDQHGGFVDKFIGDAVMAIFAQNDPTEQARMAVRASIKMLHNLETMVSFGFPISSTGIGINTGRTLIGILGTESRMEPTSIGDTVNLAARTESLCKSYGAKLIITEFTYEKLGSEVESLLIRELDHVAVKGKNKPCKIYEVLDAEPEEVRVLKASLLMDWGRAMAAYHLGLFEDSLVLFEKCISIYPEDRASQLYAVRCRELIQSPSFDRSSWDGVYKLTSK